MSDEKENEIEVAPQRQHLTVKSNIAVFDTARFEHMWRVAIAMAKASVLPDALREGGSQDAIIGNCFQIINQAFAWDLEPFALAQTAFKVHGKFGYPGLVFSAVIDGDPKMAEKLDYQYYGDEGTEGRGVVVSGRLEHHKVSKTIKGTVKMWRTFNKDGSKVNAAWLDDPDQMLAYRGARVWAKRYNPARIMGAYADEDSEETRAANATDITHKAVEVVAPEKPAETLPSETSEKQPDQEDITDAVFEDGDILPPKSKEDVANRLAEEGHPEEAKQALDPKPETKTAKKANPKPPKDAASTGEGLDIMPPKQAAAEDDGFPGGKAKEKTVDENGDTLFVAQAMYELTECLNFDAVMEWINDYADAVKEQVTADRWVELEEIIDAADAKYTEA